MRKLAIYLFLALVTTFCFTGIGSASLIDLQYAGVDYRVAVNVSGSSGSSSLTNQSIWAGLYQLLIRDPSGHSGPYESFDAYCVDPQWAPTASAQYSREPIVQGTLLGAAVWVLSQNYTTTAAEAQVAVWRLTWDIFTLNSGFDAAQQAVSDGIYASALANMATFDPSGYYLAHNADKQDYIYHPVPLPSSALLLSSGILGLVGLGWRRRKTKT